MSSRALVVNLYGGPGTGKSTMACGLVAHLKYRHCCTELVSEYAKDLVWGQDKTKLNCQPRVSGEQLWRLVRLENQVDVIVTDSPLLLGSIYAGQWGSAAYEIVLLDWYRRFRNFNVMLTRDPAKPYDQRGREQNQAQAIAVDQMIRAKLDAWHEPYDHWPAKEATVPLLGDHILKLLHQEGQADAS